MNERLDRNFDDLAPKFQRKVYGNLKGDIRLAVLKKDIAQFYPKALQKIDGKPLNILDAGSGYGPFSIFFAQLGHLITLCDVSENMLDMARKEIETQNLQARTKLIHSSIQKLNDDHNAVYDMVLCHAVLEWVQDPEDLIRHLVQRLKPGGILSLTFYNQNGMIFKNLLRTNYKKIINKQFKGWPGSLTPTHPLDPDQVVTWIDLYPLKILCRSGIRVFHDYILNIEDQKRHPDTVIELELAFSRKTPYRDLGRYQHILLQKT